MDALQKTGKTLAESYGWKKEILIITKLLAIILILIIAICTYIFFDLCSNEKILTSHSPSNKIKVVITERNCGATTSYNYIVEIGERNSYFLTKAGWIYGATINSDKNGVKVIWLSDSEVQVQYSRAHYEKLDQPSVTIDGTPIKISFVQGMAFKDGTK